MFTGIVEEIGTVQSTTVDAELGKSLTIGCATVVADAAIGDSIAINGICLTVTASTATSFTIGVTPETLRRTNLGRLNVGDPVNLERSLAFGGRMGGHYVQGHVDGTSEIVDVAPDGDSLRVTIRPPEHLLPYIVEKGYVAVDGTSLTVAERSADTFTIALIAYTQGAVILGHQQPGAQLNLEVDIMAKYVESIMQQYLPTPR